MEEYLISMLPFWKQLTPRQQEEAARSVLVRCYRKGEFIYNPLKKSGGLRLVISGRIRILVTTAQGRGITLEWLGKGEVCALSILCLMNLMEPDLCAEVEEESQVLVIPELIYRKLHEENQAVRDFNYQIVIGSMSRMMGMISRAALATAEERLADLLLRSSERSGADVLLLTHEEIARDIGTAREVVSRILNQMKREQIIRQGRGRLEIVDREALESVRDGQKR